ncbi:MAG: ABC transporter permease [Acidobacteria bacterium]|nr:ABC transporter permease [Acidobacteriota bacterium]
MSWWTRRREGLEDDLDKEMRFHLDAYTDDLIRSGLPRPEALRRARVQFGSVEGAKDACRRERNLRPIEELEQAMTNVRLALRMLVKTPVVTSVAVVSLALGIGSNAAIFSLYSQFLLRPLPVVEPERLVNLEAPGPKPGSDSCTGQGGCDEVFSYPMFRDLQREQTVFTDLVAHRGFGASVAHEGRTIDIVQGMQVSGSYFPTLGLVPALGRLFGPEVDEPIGGHPVAVLSHAFWQTQLGGAGDVVGDVLLVNGEPLTIVGVTPAGFSGTAFNMPSMVFVPLTMHARLGGGFGEGRFEDRRNYWLYLFARRKPDVSLEQARAAMTPLYRSILTDVEAPLQTDMSEEMRARFLAKPLPIVDGWRGQSGAHESFALPLILLLGITGVVLLIACANIANLLLARSAARASEMAVRLSLGATRRQLVTQLLTESCLLATLGGVAGLLAAPWTLRFIAALLPPRVAEVLQLTLDPYALPFTAAVALATGLLFGIFPAFHGTRGALVTALKHDAGQPDGARSAAGFRSGLVMAQFALAAMLLVVTGLFVQSLRNVSGADLGIRTHDVVTFRLWPGLNGYGDEQARAFFERLEAEMAAQPGVTGATAASIPVFVGDSWAIDVRVEGFEAPPDTDRETRFNQVGTDYFRTLGIPLLAGRTFTEADVRAAPPVAIVNEAFARKFALGRGAVGRRLGRGGLDAELDTEIVGLVADTRYNSVKTPAPPLLYVPYRQADTVGSLAFYARSTVPPEAALRTVRPLVAALDPNLPVTQLMTLPRLVEEAAFEDRVITLLSAAFAGLATLLAAVGLYGVLAYTVALRTREIGLRMALGAGATRVRAMVLGHVARLTLVAGAVGLAAAFGVGRLARSLLYEIEGLTPAPVAVSVLTLAAVALAAGFVPARRASRIDPMAALRQE